MAVKTMSLFAAVAVSMALLGLLSASGPNPSIYGIHLANLLNPGQPLNASQPPSTYQWSFTAQMNASGSGQGAYAYINASDMRYREPNGVTVTAAYPLIVTGAPGGKNAFYFVSGPGLVPVQLMSSYTTGGSVYQGMQYQNATAARQCESNSSLYTEWDFYVTVQPGFLQSPRNVVVARVCIYAHTIGYAERLPDAPALAPGANFTVDANGQADSIGMLYNSGSAVSADRLVSASWSGNYMSIAAAPNGSQYAAVSNLNGTKWYVQTYGAYKRWYNQYYKFAQGKIPAIRSLYSPNNVNFLSASCNVVSSTALSNKSIAAAVSCMNQTAALYYSLSNQLASGMMANGQSIANYTATEANYSGRVALTITLPSRFIGNPVLEFTINGQLLGASLPGGAVRILAARASPIGIDGAGMLKITFKNSGTTPGLFKVSLNGCPSIRAESGMSYQAYAGQTLNISVPITAPTTNFSISSVCTVSVTTSNGGSDTMSVEITSQTPNQFLHSGIQKLENAICSYGGFLTQLACRYLSRDIGP